MSRPDLITELATAHRLQDKGLLETLREKYTETLAMMRMCIEDGHCLHPDVYEDARDVLTALDNMQQGIRTSETRGLGE